MFISAWPALWQAVLQIALCSVLMLLFSHVDVFSYARHKSCFDRLVLCCGYCIVVLLFSPVCFFSYVKHKSCFDRFVLCLGV